MSTWMHSAFPYDGRYNASHKTKHIISETHMHNTKGVYGSQDCLELCELENITFVSRDFLFFCVLSLNV